MPLPIRQFAACLAHNVRALFHVNSAKHWLQTLYSAAGHHAGVAFNSAMAFADKDFQLEINPPRLRRLESYAELPGRVPAQSILDLSIQFGQSMASIQEPGPAHLAVLIPADLR